MKNGSTRADFGIDLSVSTKPAGSSATVLAEPAGRRVRPDEAEQAGAPHRVPPACGRVLERRALEVGATLEGPDLGVGQDLDARVHLDAVDQVAGHVGQPDSSVE